MFGAVDDFYADLPPIEGIARAAVYARVSSQAQKLNGSLQAQADHCRAHATARGYALLEPSYLEVFPSDEPERPVLDEVMEDAKAGRFDVLVVDLMDRFSRGDPGITSYILIELKRRGVRVEFVEVPENTFEAEIVRAVLAILSRFEGRKIKARTQAGRRRRITGQSQRFEGPRLYASKTPLYGYLWDDPTKGERGRYVPDTNGLDGDGERSPAAIVARIFREIASGTPVRTLCRMLTEEGVLSPGQYWVACGVVPPDDDTAPAGWQRQTVQRIIDEPKYWGKGYANRRSFARAKRRNPVTGRAKHVIERHIRPADDERVVAIPVELCPPLIDEATALAAKEQLRRVKEQHARPAGEYAVSALLRHMVYCARCGRRMAVRKHAPKANGMPRAHYTCVPKEDSRVLGMPWRCPAGIPNNLRTWEVDGPVWEAAVRALLDPEFLPTRLFAGEAEARETAAAREHTSNELAKLIARSEERVSSFYAALGDVPADDAEGRTKLFALIAEEREHIRTRSERKEQMDAEAAQGQVAVEALRRMRDRLPLWGLRVAEWNDEQKVAWLMALGTRVDVWPEAAKPAGQADRWTLTFNVPVGLDWAAVLATLEGNGGPGNGAGNGTPAAAVPAMATGPLGAGSVSHGDRTHLFEEPGALERVALLARDWLAEHLRAAPPHQVYQGEIERARDEP